MSSCGEIGRREVADRDPAIKIFGRTIPLPDSDPVAALDLDPVACSVDGEEEIRRETTNMEAKDPKPDVTEEKDQGEAAISSVLNNSHEDGNQTCTQDDKGTTASKSEQDQSEADTSGQDKVLKKPDKLLPCPRCNSMDTKFCYYNNYNVNQPRHFCKNCQRYWTAGGMMRNVPVGAGRRKSKHSGYLQTLPGGLSAPLRPLNENGAILKFGPEAPLCESMSSVLNLEEHKRNAKIRSMAGGGNGEEPSCASSVTASNRVEKDLTEKAVHKEQNVFHGSYTGLPPMHPMQYFPGPPWPYWGPGWNDAAAMAASHYSENGITNPLLWGPPPMLAAPAFCTPPVPYPFMPPSYWPCMPNWPNGAWNAPWSGTNGSTVHSGNGSPTLGKHLRDDSSQEEEKSERSLWVPKTLRIHDPDEAAKSSIWSTLGIKPDESMKRRGLFKAFQPNNESSDHTSSPAQILHANPAALSRSRVFQEST